MTTCDDLHLFLIWLQDNGYVLCIESNDAESKQVYNKVSESNNDLVVDYMKVYK